MSFLGRFLRFFFRHFYSTLAWTYDLVAAVVSVGQWNDWVYSVLEPEPARPILELAHGPGHLLLRLSQHGDDVVGIDRSRQMCRIANRRLRREGISSRVVQARVQNLPFANEHFATVLSTFPTEFILDPTTLSEARRILVPNGQLRVVPMAEIRGRSLFERMAAWLFRTTGQYAELSISWADPLTSAGFEVHRQDVELERSRVIQLIAIRTETREGQVA